MGASCKADIPPEYPRRRFHRSAIPESMQRDIVAPFRGLWRLIVRRPESPDKIATGKSRADAASYRRKYFQDICVDAIRRYARIANKESTEPVAEERFAELLEHIIANFEADYESQFTERLNTNPSVFISAALYDTYTNVLRGRGGSNQGSRASRDIQGKASPDNGNPDANGRLHGIY